ncbi:15894_t:CDS:2, partial [Acaulospora morrowiae]
DSNHNGIFGKKWSGLRHTNPVTKLLQVLSDCSHSYIKIWIGPLNDLVDFFASSLLFWIAGQSI